MTNKELRNFLEIPYDELEALNLEAKGKVKSKVPQEELREHYRKYLIDTKEIKAVTVGFSDLEGRFHMLDYDKKFLLKAEKNLTFDGSSIKGFSVVSESDLRIALDWSSFRWLPSDIFGPGKVIMFTDILDKSGQPYMSDMRGLLKSFTNDLYTKQKMTAQVSVECEGFLFNGLNAEQNFNSKAGFSLVSTGGYFHSLPNDPLKLFIDGLAEAQRALGFENEKDHPEVAPSQFELNYTYVDALLAADLVQLYKLLARQVAANMGLTASFLPKPIQSINGSGMHCNISIQKANKNIFYDAKGEESVSELAWKFVDRILNNANDLCLILNPSVNAYRRLDPHFEAPNQIKASAVDRTSMIRIPIGDEKSARIEVRTVAPDANPYLSFLVLFDTGLRGPMKEAISSETRRSRTRYLPDNIYDAIRLFKESDWIEEIIGVQNKDKFVELKTAAAHRCPRDLGSKVKSSEVLFHHEVVNQGIWNNF